MKSKLPRRRYDVPNSGSVFTETAPSMSTSILASVEGSSYSDSGSRPSSNGGRSTAPAMKRGVVVAIATASTACTFCAKDGFGSQDVV